MTIGDEMLRQLATSPVHSSAASVADSSTRDLPAVPPSESSTAAGNTTQPSAEDMQDPLAEDPLSLHRAVVRLQHKMDDLKDDFNLRLSAIQTSLAETKALLQPHQHQESHYVSPNLDIHSHSQDYTQWYPGYSPAMSQGSHQPHQVYHPNHPGPTPVPLQQRNYGFSDGNDEFSNPLWNVGNAGAHRPEGQ